MATTPIIGIATLTIVLLLSRFVSVTFSSAVGEDKTGTLEGGLISVGPFVPVVGIFVVLFTILSTGTEVGLFVASVVGSDVAVGNIQGGSVAWAIGIGATVGVLLDTIAGGTLTENTVGEADGNADGTAAPGITSMICPWTTNVDIKLCSTTSVTKVWRSGHVAILKLDFIVVDIATAVILQCAYYSDTALLLFNDPRYFQFGANATVISMFTICSCYTSS